jgi:hypothetical protein
MPAPAAIAMSVSREGKERLIWMRATSDLPPALKVQDELRLGVTRSPYGFDEGGMIVRDPAMFDSRSRI